MPSAISSNAHAAAATARVALKHGKPRSMKERLIGHLKRGFVTPLDALNLVGCLSLSQRCGELEREGHAIDRVWRDLPSGKRVRAYRILKPTRWTA